jgi:predicted AAA+ superfamily ATPase
MITPTPNRTNYLQYIRQAFVMHPIVALVGPRQCGKTTLARQYIQHISQQNTPDIHYFDLEDPSDQTLFDNPKILLSNLKGLIIIDEVQHAPNLFALLRVLVDRPNNHQQFLVLGSASYELLQQSSETLAGRIEFIEVTPFDFQEIQDYDIKKLWLRGGFPKSFLAPTDEHSFNWRSNYIRTFLERDIPALGIKVPPQNIRRFWQMLAHYHGNVLNGSELARSLSLSQPTIKHYIDILCGTFMIRQLQPWFSNISKRQVKSPKIYFRDSGILHSLLNLESYHSLQHHPKLGASWEGFALEQIIRKHDPEGNQSYFWGTQSGAELDLLINIKGEPYGFEFKYTDTPKTTKSMHIAIEDLQLKKLFLMTPSSQTYTLDEKIEALNLEHYLTQNSQ